MEELQSTEILDREILEDARKKAMRILKSAEETMNVQNAEWEQKTLRNIEDLNKKYNEHKRIETEKLMARLPIDRIRIKIEKIESLLQSAAESWYKSCRREQLLELLSMELSKRLTVAAEELTDKNGQSAEISGLTISEAESVLKAVNVVCTIKEAPCLHNYPSITLNTDNIRIIVSIESIIDNLLDLKRAELTTALVGGGFMEDE